MNLPADPTSVYRFFDADGQLLYVGITRRAAARWDQHAREKPWWPDVASATVEHFPTRFEAEEAEYQAITTEGPRHNIAHAVPRTRSTPRRRPAAPAVEADQVFFTLPQVAARWGVSRRTVERRINDGRLRSHRFGGSTRIKRSDVEDFERIAIGMQTTAAVGL